MEGLSENPSGVELDEVCFNPNLDQIFKNEAWASDAVYVTFLLISSV